MKTLQVLALTLIALSFSDLRFCLGDFFGALFDSFLGDLVVAFLPTFGFGVALSFLFKIVTFSEAISSSGSILFSASESLVGAFVFFLICLPPCLVLRLGNCLALALFPRSFSSSEDSSSASSSESFGSFLTSIFISPAAAGTDSTSYSDPSDSSDSLSMLGCQKSSFTGSFVAAVLFLLAWNLTLGVWLPGVLTRFFGLLFISSSSSVDSLSELEDVLSISRFLLFVIFFPGL